jgi:predicted nucleic acid-binding protein
VKVVSDTSPICYLILIGEIDLLPRLYGRIYIPQRVAVELKHPKAPSIVRNWIGSPPAWVEILAVSPRVSPGLELLQAGEREAILLTENLSAGLVIMDDRRARDAALKRGLPVTGLLGVLGRAAEKKLVALPDAFDRLLQTSFRADPRFLRALLARYSQ